MTDAKLLDVTIESGLSDVCVMWVRERRRPSNAWRKHFSDWQDAFAEAHSLGCKILYTPPFVGKAAAQVYFCRETDLCADPEALLNRGFRPWY